MGTNRGRLLFLSLALADSSWIFAATSLFAIVFGLSASPLSWPLILGLLILSLFVGWVAIGARGDIVSLALLQGGIGAAAIYLAVGLRSAEEASGMEWSWLIRLTRGDLGQVGGTVAVVTLVVSVLLWRRGLRLVIDDTPWDTLHQTFRRGIAVIAVALLAEVIADRDLGVRLIIFPFFGASLGGMALGRIAESGGWGVTGGLWGRVIAGTVLGVLALGVGLGLAGSTLGAGPVRLVGTAAAAVRDGVFWVVSFPLKYVAMGVFALINWLVGLFGSGERPELKITGAEGAPIEGVPQEAAEQSSSTLIDMIVSILAWPIALIIVLILLYILAKMLRRSRLFRSADDDSERESIRGDSDPRADLMNLLGRLIPRLSRGGAGGQGFRYPANEPGVTEVFQLYFGYLVAAAERGARLDACLTPGELQPVLAENLPGTSIELLTQRFNAACYGHEPTDSATIERLDRELRVSLASPETDVVRPGDR